MRALLMLYRASWYVLVASTLAKAPKAWLSEVPSALPQWVLLLAFGSWVLRWLGEIVLGEPAWRATTLVIGLLVIEALHPTNFTVWLFVCGWLVHWRGFDWDKPAAG